MTCLSLMTDTPLPVLSSNFVSIFVGYKLCCNFKVVSLSVTGFQSVLLFNVQSVHSASWFNSAHIKR